MIKKYVFVLLSAVFVLSACSQGSPAGVSGVVLSSDGVPISFEVYPGKDPTLVFVHGWSCDARYWKEQIPFFAKKYRVVTVDLAGHGHSGFGRNRYTVAAFGQDVKAAVDAVQADRVILIGHSMGGAVVAEAAKLMPKRVIGIVGVDTLQDVAYQLKPEKFEEMVGPMERDFRSGVKAFVSEMFAPDTDPALVEWIADDMSSAPPEVAISSSREYLGQYMTGESADRFSDIDVPVISINTDQWPTDIESNRKHIKKYDAIIIKGAGHFLMLAKPDLLNEALERTIRKLSCKA
jgi:pimeloyl-ACP methyl ester carboxylesterase